MFKDLLREQLIDSTKFSCFDSASTIFNYTL